MGVEERDWYRETPKRPRRTILWVVGAIMLAAALLAASPPGHRLLGLPGARFSGERPFHEDIKVAPLPGGPAITVHQAPLYAESDPWKRFLADERTCPGGERTDLPPNRQVEVMLCLIDWARQQHGLTMPMQTALLTSTAIQKAHEIVRCENFAHSPCGADPATDVRRTAYRGAWGENLYIADGRFGAPRIALDGWLNSPDHRENLFRPEWKTQGIALAKIDRFGPYRGRASGSRSSARSDGRGASAGLVELDEQVAEPGELRCAELLRPLLLHLGDRIADRTGHRLAAARQRDAPRAAVLGVGPPLDVPETLELSELVVQSLLAHPQALCELRRSQPLWAGVLDDREMRRIDVVEAPLVQPLEHADPKHVERHPQQRADQRWAERLGARAAGRKVA